MLIEAIKEKLIEVCAELVLHYQCEGDQFLPNILTGDESWVHHYDPESKRPLQRRCSTATKDHQHPKNVLT